jgi:hypothetical protein
LYLNFSTYYGKSVTGNFPKKIFATFRQKLRCLEHIKTRRGKSHTRKVETSNRDLISMYKLSIKFKLIELFDTINQVLAAPVHDLNDELQFYKSRYEIAVILFPIFGLITFYFIFATIYIGKLFAYRALFFLTPKYIFFYEFIFFQGKKYFLVKKTILKPQQADELVSKEAPSHINITKPFSLTTSSIDRHVDKELEEPPKYVV